MCDEVGGVGVAVGGISPPQAASVARSSKPTAIAARGKIVLQIRKFKMRDSVVDLDGTSPGSSGIIVIDAWNTAATLDRTRGGCGMSYDVNRLRGTHPPACTCVQCSAARNRGRRRGGGGRGPGGRRFGCLPILLALPMVLAATLLAVAVL